MLVFTFTPGLQRLNVGIYLYSWTLETECWYLSFLTDSSQGAQPEETLETAYWYLPLLPDSSQGAQPEETLKTEWWNLPVLPDPSQGTLCPNSKSLYTTCFSQRHPIKKNCNVSGIGTFKTPSMNKHVLRSSQKPFGPIL